MITWPNIPLIDSIQPRAEQPPMPALPDGDVSSENSFFELIEQLLDPSSGEIETKAEESTVGKTFPRNERKAETIDNRIFDSAAVAPTGNPNPLTEPVEPIDSADAPERLEKLSAENPPRVAMRTQPGSEAPIDFSAANEMKGNRPTLSKMPVPGKPAVVSNLNDQSDDGTAEDRETSPLVPKSKSLPVNWGGAGDETIPSAEPIEAFEKILPPKESIPAAIPKTPSGTSATTFAVNSIFDPSEETETVPEKDSFRASVVFEEIAGKSENDRKNIFNESVVAEPRLPEQTSKTPNRSDFFLESSGKPVRSEVSEVENVYGEQSAEKFPEKTRQRIEKSPGVSDSTITKMIVLADEMPETPEAKVTDFGFDEALQPAKAPDSSKRFVDQANGKHRVTPDASRFSQKTRESVKESDWVDADARPAGAVTQSGSASERTILESDFRDSSKNFSVQEAAKPEETISAEPQLKSDRSTDYRERLDQSQNEPDSLISPAGKEAAKQDAPMKFMEERNKFAERTLQKLPRLVSGERESFRSAEVPDAKSVLEKSERIEQTPAHFSILDSLANSRVADAVKTFSSNAVESRENVPDQIERLAGLINTEVLAIRKTSARSLTVSLKIDASTEISLGLANREGKVQALIQCERGDLSVLENHWGQLQESLSRHDVQLLPLQQTGSSGASLPDFQSSASSHFQQQSQRQEQGHGSSPEIPFKEMFSENAAPVARFGKPKNAVVKSGWESWA